MGTLTIYEGCNARFSVQAFKDGGEPCYKLEHSDAANAPTAMIFRKEGKLTLLLDFHSVYVDAEEWAHVKVATDEMLALWQEYRAGEQ